MKKKIISWMAYDYKFEQKSVDWYWIFSISFFSIISFFVYYLDDLVFGMMLFIIFIIIIIANIKKPILRKYEIDNNNFYLDDRKQVIEFAEIESYFIDTYNYRILINTQNKYKPLVYIPFEEDQNMFRIDQFLSKKIKKNPELRIPTIELFFNKIFGL